MVAQVCNPALGRLKQKARKFEASLGYILRPVSTAVKQMTPKFNDQKHCIFSHNFWDGDLGEMGWVILMASLMDTWCPASKSAGFKELYSHV
jgi:hypothetical protein